MYKKRYLTIRVEDVETKKNKVKNKLSKTRKRASIKNIKYLFMYKTKNNKKWIATFFLSIFLPTLLPIDTLYAANNGPNAPEAASFEPVDASDMVSLATGDMAYVLPLLNVPSPEGGYPLVLSYHGGIGYDQESSMVGLGWNLNPGAINRNVNGAPDDWKGAPIRDKSHFESWGKSTDLSIGYQCVDVSVGYSWDSNGTTKGSVGIGFGYKQSGVNLGAGIGYSVSNTTGSSGYMTTSIGTQNGFGVGTYGDTDGLMGVGVSHGTNFGRSQTAKTSSSMSTVGFSLSSNKGQVGVGLSGGGNGVLNTSSGGSSASSLGFSAGIYLYGFFAKLGYQQSTFSRDKLDYDYVYGPLYYSALSNNPIGPNSSSDISYPGGLANEHNRDVYMDAYSQPTPEYIGNAVSYNDAFESQKSAYNAPAYDTYEVNAQGLSGRMSPRLLENGLIVNPGINIEYAEERGDENGTCINLCPDHSALLDCISFESRGTKITNKRLFVNSHYTTNPNHTFKNTFGQANSNLNFYFDYQFPSDLRINSLPQVGYENSSNLENYFASTTNTAITTRKENSDYIETYTNGQIVSGATNGQFLEAKGYDRFHDKGYRADGIGGYKITTADGKTYHYSRPVYQFEQIYRQLAGKDSNHDGVDDAIYSESDGFYREVQKIEPYATHWLLTAITGPDYVKMSSNPYPDQGDYGYWVRFDYGKWTDGYAWRTPYDGYENTSSNMGTISDEYSWGRKQLVYLDKVVTRTHTALFVKSLRQDDLGKNIGAGGYPSNEGDQNVTYSSQKPLKLDEIILLKNSDYNNAVEASTQVTNLTTEPNEHTAHWNTLGDITYSMNQQLQVIDKGDFVINPVTGKFDIYSKAQKVIKLNQSYDLAKGSSNSTAAGGGRLTLESVEALGKGAESIVPPYSFDYLGKQTNYNSDPYQKDAWGYNVTDPTLWTLNKIHTPTGASIEFNYEKDQYYTEAFSRRMFDEDNLMFRTYAIEGQPVIEFQKHIFWVDPIDFTQYFDATDPTWGSLFCCHDNDANGSNGGHADWITVPGQAFTIRSVSTNSIIFNLPPPPNYVMDGDYGMITGGNGNFIGKNITYCSISNQCGNDGHTSFNFNFKLMANKTPGTGYGGGIRVAKISTVNEMGQKLSTEYNYNHPIKNRTSGITSYAPERGKKYVAYQSEIPGPRVMYEYVTMTEKGMNNETLGKTQYQFNVLKPVLNVFDPNLQSGNHFKATASFSYLDATKGSWGTDVKLEDNFGTVGSVVSVSQINKAGQIMSQVKNNFLTLNELEDNAVEKPGVLQESFHSVKSVYDYNRNWISGSANTGFANWTEKCDINQTIALNKRIITSSSKITYPVVQKSKEEIVGNQKQVTEFMKIDPKTGMFLESQTTLANGTLIKTEQVPAYTKYPEMGSKVDNINNKHMLTQEAMSITSVKVGNQWQTVNANITAWNKNWSYRDNFGAEDSNAPKVWRKQKTFSWKGPLEADGTYNTTVTNANNYFDWGTNTPTVGFWQKTSEVTRYNHFSSPIETKDINGNFASSKMADKDSKVIVSGNARYTEMYYSGAEHVESGNYFEGEVQGAAFRSNNVAHTGKYSIKPNAIGDKLFEVIGSSGPANYYANTNNPYTQTFRPGKYKVSFWALRQENPSCEVIPNNEYGINLLVNNTSIDPAEVVSAGCWHQINYIIDIPENTAQNSIVVRYIGAPCGSVVYYDDFRMHPIASRINSYVYDDKTDELSYILDGNNMASAFKYDDGGRLIGKYIEDIDVDSHIGGFKLVSQSKQNYKGSVPSINTLSATIDNCYHNENHLDITISNQCVGTFTNKFKVDVSGGSGNYSYQYKWMDNFINNTYTNYVAGGNQYLIPYAPVFCSGNAVSGAYGKRWDFVVKVKDLNTNFEVEKAYNYQGDCAFKKNKYLDTELEVINCYPLCPGQQSAFRVHLKDIGDGTNMKYEYAYFTDWVTPLPNQTLDWVDVTSTNGIFCPVYSSSADENCPSGIRKILRLAYRTTNLTTGQVSDIQAYYDNICN